MIQKYLKELLFDVDILAIPGLGSFLTETHPAQISISNNKILPPSKKITFNEKIQVGDDETFVKYLAQNQTITFLEAKNSLFRFAGEVKFKLNTEKQFIIEELGRLYQNKDGSIGFEQFTQYNYLNESFGLPDIYLQPIVRNNEKIEVLQPKNIQVMQDTMDNENVNSENEEDEYQKYATKGSGLGWYYFAVVCSLMFALSTYYYLNMNKETYALGSFDPISFFKGGNSEAFSNNNSDISENKLLPESETDENTTEQQGVKKDENTVVENTDTESVNDNSIVENAKKESSQLEEEAIDFNNAITSKSGRYYLIVGSFKKSSLANSYLSELKNKGLDAKIIAQEGNTETLRISAADFDDYNQATSKKAEIVSQLGSDAWILNY